MEKSILTTAVKEEPSNDDVNLDNDFGRLNLEFFPDRSLFHAPRTLPSLNLKNNHGRNLQGGNSSSDIGCLDCSDSDDPFDEVCPPECPKTCCSNKEGENYCCTSPPPYLLVVVGVSVCVCVCVRERERESASTIPEQN